MIKLILKIVALFVLLGLFIGVAMYWENIKGLWPALGSKSGDIVKIIEDNNQKPAGPAENNTEFPLKLPEGFKIEIYAKDLPNARAMVTDGLGNMWVSQSSSGIITQLEIKDGKVIGQNAVFRGLNRPHGLAVDPQSPNTLYIAEEDGVSRVQLYSEDTLHRLVDLPEGGGHSTRTIAFGPDDRLYISIGSSCNVCEESDERRAAIYVMDKDGGNFKEYASGLRNAVFFTWSEIDGRMWATDNSRDLLGDDVPPDEINVVVEGGNYGWPNCYGNNIHDTQYDKKTYIINPCMEPFEIPSKVDLQAHSAPLGLDFIPEEGWPEEYWYDLIVAYHGSWNRTVPTGYKLVRIKLDEKGNYQGTEDFITGWLTPSGALGRPVAVMTEPGGYMYVTDDKAGVIYKISYQSE